MLQSAAGAAVGPGTAAAGGGTAGGRDDLGGVAAGTRPQGRSLAVSVVGEPGLESHRVANILLTPRQEEGRVLRKNRGLKLFKLYQNKNLDFY